jgi:hypothetical protein
MPPNVNISASALYGVSCTGLSWCTAVGSYTINQGPTLTLGELRPPLFLVASPWSYSPTQNTAGATSSYLNGVSCAPKAVFPYLWSNTCEAAGSSDMPTVPTTAVTLAEQGP